jgi:creatinine amidohydrolase
LIGALALMNLLGVTGAACAQPAAPGRSTSLSKGSLGPVDFEARAMPTASPPPARRGVLLEQLTWQQAEAVLRADSVVVLPLGAAAREHGPHLLLGNDYLLAEGLKRRLLERADVVMAPTVPYHYYPAFVEYPGSTGLRLETARDLIVDIVRSLARHGPRRFYVLNTGVSTVRALQPAAELLARDGILLRYTDLLASLQAGGTHADESETSMMLFLRPDTVDMTKAQRDFNPKRPGPFTRNPDGPGTWSPTGTWGDPTLATAHKGERLVTGLVEALVRDIEAVRGAPLPAP